ASCQNYCCISLKGVIFRITDLGISNAPYNIRNPYKKGGNPFICQSKLLEESYSKCLSISLRL
ncbi:MAG: hypothetical protein ACK5CR_20135, partial [Pseudanabaena sp.]